MDSEQENRESKIKQNVVAGIFGNEALKNQY